MDKILILVFITLCLALAQGGESQSKVVSLLRRLASYDKRMTGPPAPHGFKKFGGNCPGGQVLGTKTQLIAMHECAIQCLLNNLCAGFSYGGLNPKECRLKTSVCLYPLSTSRATFYARMNEGDAKHEHVNNGKQASEDFDKILGNCPGNQMGNLMQRSVDGCAWNCLQKAGCVGFSYGGWSKTDCRLKSKACKHPLAGLAVFYKLNEHKKAENAITKPNKGAGPSEQTTHLPGVFLKHFKKVGGDCVNSLKIITHTSVEECAQACVNDGEVKNLCGGFSVVEDQQICYLKQGCENPVSPSSAVYWERISGGPPKATTKPSTQSSGSLLDQIRTECLREINELRAKHCAPPLKVNATLEAAAQEWAAHEADIGAPLTSAWVHNYAEKTKELGWPPLSLGQNLAYFPYDWPESQPVTAAKICKSVVTDQWYGEKKEYEATGGYTNRANSALWGPYLHFVQIVWKDTKYVGFGYKEGRVAADFSPMSGIAPVGNYYRNVKAPTCSKKREAMLEEEEEERSASDSFEWEDN